MESDLPDVIAEVKTEFERYERALVSNDVAALNKLFHNTRARSATAAPRTFTGIPRLRPFVLRDHLSDLNVLCRELSLVVMGATVPLPRRFIIGRMRLKKWGARCRPGCDLQMDGVS
jgi:hypothetical protein